VRVWCGLNRIAPREKIGMSGRERFEDLASDPHLVDVMQRAHEKACVILELGRNRDDAATGIVLAKIIELAEAGETDADRLCCKALMEVSDQMG
jgi:2-methylaconitate cis-trans-isomerase PrpF